MWPLLSDFWSLFNIEQPNYFLASSEFNICGNQLFDFAQVPVYCTLRPDLSLVCPECQAMHLDLRPDDAIERLLLFRPEDRLLEPVFTTC